MKKIWKSNKNLNFEIWPWDPSKSKDLVLLIISLQDFWSEAFIVKISSQFTFLLELWSAGRLEPVFVNMYVINTLLIVTIYIVTTGLFYGSLLPDGCLMVVSWLSHGFCFYVCSFVFMLVYLLLNLYLFIIYASWMSV